MSAAAVRRAVERLIDRYRRHRTGPAIADGYAQRPQTEAEVGWADDATRRMIGEEPW